MVLGHIVVADTELGGQTPGRSDTGYNAAAFCLRKVNLLK